MKNILGSNNRSENFKTVSASTIVLISFIIILAGPAASARLDPKRLEQAKTLLKLSDLSRGNVTGIEWDIDIESFTSGRHQKQALRIKVKNTNSLATFLSPAKVKGRKLLMRDRNMWFIKPGLSKPIPISPRQKLLGGASNGDIASTNYYGDYTISVLDDGTFKGEDCLVYDLSSNTKNTTYDRIRYWISKTRTVGIKAEFYTISGKLFKTAEFEYGHTIFLNNQKRSFISKMNITNAVLKEDKTFMTYKNIEIKKIPASAFNINLLIK